jgi:hypothetical protein
MPPKVARVRPALMPFLIGTLGIALLVAAVLVTKPHMLLRPRNVFDADLTVLDRFSHALATKAPSSPDMVRRCNPTPIGKGYGSHVLCMSLLRTTVQPCYFYSFGIQKDWSFDTNLVNVTGCIGFAADPSVVHPSILTPQVTFHHVAAKSLRHEDNTRWLAYTSMPGLRKWLRHEQIAVLKMDCEGCEYSLASDILEEDPQFFSRVDQFAVEVHYSRKWLKGSAELFSFASLLELLQEAGLVLAHSYEARCNPKDQATGVDPRIPFGSVKQQNRHCHNYLFARV